MSYFNRSDFYRDIDIDTVIKQNDPLFIMFISDSPIFTPKKDTRTKYKHYIYGCLENLQKCVIEMTDILLTIDIELQSNVVIAEKLALQNILLNNGCRKIELVKAKPFREFSYEHRVYARCYFDQYNNRINAINAISDISSSMIVSKEVANNLYPNKEIKLSTNKKFVKIFF